MSQVEGSVQVNGQSTWMPDVSLGEFAGKTISNLSGAPAGIYSGHATAVGAAFYGSSTGIARGISRIDSYGVDQWLGSGFLWFTDARQPASSPSRISNHSWVGSFASANSQALRRLDWLIETDDMVQVTGVPNAPGVSTSPLLAAAFNGIAPGISNGAHSVGTMAIDANYVAGRVRPDIVVPASNTSMAAAHTSSAVALLVATGHASMALSTDPLRSSFTNRAGLLIRNAERTEVVKAALMAGADRVTHNSSTGNLARYRASGYRAVNGLDTRWGAGQLNIRNSYHIVASGEQNSTQDGGAGSGSASRGFDYDPAFGGSNGTNITATYVLPVAAVPRLLTAALVVNVDIHGGTASSFNGAAYFRDLSLSVVNVAQAGNPVTIATSQSTIDNTEHVWLSVPANAHYALRVDRVGTTSYSHDYALAWQVLPDADRDGAHDGMDNCTDAANGPLIADAGGNIQLDSDRDGYGNACDADLDNSGFTTSVDYRIQRGLMNAAAGSGALAAAADMNGSGIVSSVDFNMLSNRLNTPPGPSGLLQSY